MKEYDWIIIGAGIYGLYFAKLLSEKNISAVVLEYDDAPFKRASYINQARVHNGYHYPRSLSTAIKSAAYFDRFNKDFNFAINNKFDKVYAISSKFSLASSNEFKKFCHNANIPCKEIEISRYFKKAMVEGAYITKEYSFDAFKIRDYFIQILSEKKNIDIYCNMEIKDVIKNNNKYIIDTGEKRFCSSQVLNATYASINQIIDMFNFEKFKIKYEICEIILVNVSKNIYNIGLTVMDGPFFSIMPFGLSGFHSLTSVTFTPHITSYEKLPNFICQKNNDLCSGKFLKNCNYCDYKPKTAFCYMYQLSKKYLSEDIEIQYNNSLFAIKPILIASEIDDSRPTVIKSFSKNPDFISVLSGKINTIYDLEELL